MKRDEFVIDSLGSFRVVRDDLFEGGTKRRALSQIINDFPEQTLVYAADYFGYAAYALALCANDAGKKVRLLYPGAKQETEIFQKTTSLQNVSFDIYEDTPTQLALRPYAVEWAATNSAQFLEIGFDFPAFGEALERVVKSAHLEDSKEIWCLGGSGTLSRALERAYPEVPIRVVRLGVKNFRAGNSTVYKAPEGVTSPAQIMPPYPSALTYDAKVWRFVQEHAKPGATIWNVA